jgi:hypothetical protein
MRVEIMRETNGEKGRGRDIRRTIGGAVLSLGLAIGASTPASALSILHFEDASVGTSVVSGALASLGLGGSTAFTNSTAQLNTLLGSNVYDLVIFGEQSSSTTYINAQTALDGYVAGGGRLLATTWRDGVLDGGGLAALMQATAAGFNGASIDTDTHPIFDGLGPVIGLTNPGWGIYSRGWNPLGGATGIGSLASGSAAILGNGGSTLLLGPLFDTYNPLADGELFVANSISFLLDGIEVSTPVPEPHTLALLLGGTLVAGALRRRRAAATLPSAA